MIKAVSDKIVVESLRASKTKGGLIIPDSGSDPMGYGRVLSIGEDAKGKFKVGDILVFHRMAGMDAVLDGRILRVLKYEELYGVLDHKEVESTLEALVLGPVGNSGTRGKEGIVVAP